jgi:hypothetical protein
LHGRQQEADDGDAVRRPAPAGAGHQDQNKVELAQFGVVDAVKEGGVQIMLTLLILRIYTRRETQLVVQQV